MDMISYKFVIWQIPGEKNLMSGMLLRATNTKPRRWVPNPATLDIDMEFCRRVVSKQVKATDNDYIFTEPPLTKIVIQSKVDPAHKLIINLLREENEKLFI